MKNFSRLSNCRTVEFVLIGHTPSPVLKASLGTNYCPEHDVIRSGGLFFAPSPLLFFISPMKEVWHPLAEELLIERRKSCPGIVSVSGPDLCAWIMPFSCSCVILRRPRVCEIFLKAGMTRPGHEQEQEGAIPLANFRLFRHKLGRSWDPSDRFKFALLLLHWTRSSFFLSHWI